MKKLSLNAVSTAFSKITGRTGLKIKKYSPEILIVTGIVGIVASTVIACRSTLKVESVLDEAKEKLTKIHRVHDDPTVGEDTYSEKDFKKDIVITYTQTGVELVKLYAPAVTLGVLSITSILCSFRIMRGRNLALVAAYKGMEEAFTTYRKRVTDELGIDKDREFRYGVKKEKVTKTVIGEDGKETKVKEVVETIDKDGLSLYSRFFDEYSTQWSKNAEFNLTHLLCQERFANHLLNSRGHVFLNEIYDALGLSRTPEGAIVGWVKDGNGDGCIDFGLNDPYNENFMKGQEVSALLDFNVDGVIYNKI